MSRLSLVTTAPSRAPAGAARAPHRLAARRQLRRYMAEPGFGTVEVLVAILVLTVGTLSVVGAFGSSRRLTSTAERKEAAAHVGEREIERLLSGGYQSLATTAPGSSSNPDDPRYFVRSSCPGRLAPCYQWDQSGPSTETNTEQLVIEQNGLDPGPISWASGSVSGEIHRFVTWVDDPCAGCQNPADQAIRTDYKRITVAIKLNSGPPRRPLIISTLATAPAGGATP